NIKKINEEKMNLHYTDNKSEKEVYKSLLISETYLFTETAKLNGENELIPIIENLLMLNRLKKEQTDKKSVLYKYYQQKQLTKPDLNIEETIETEVNRLKIELDSHIKNLSSNYSNYIYKKTINSIQTNISHNKQNEIKKSELNKKDNIKKKVNSLKIKLNSHIKNLSSNNSNYIYKNTLNSIQTNISQVEEG